MRNGETIGTCDAQCLWNYTAEYVEQDVAKHLARIQIEELPITACVHCRWCGSLIYSPGDCPLHGNECPLWEWELSEQAYGFVIRYMDRTHARRIPGRVMLLAREISLLHPEIVGSDVCDRVLNAYSVKIADVQCPDLLEGEVMYEDGSKPPGLVEKLIVGGKFVSHSSVAAARAFCSHVARAPRLCEGPSEIACPFLLCWDPTLYAIGASSRTASVDLGSKMGRYSPS